VNPGPFLSLEQLLEADIYQEPAGNTGNKEFQGSIL